MNPVKVSNVTKQVETMTVSSSTSSDDNGTDSTTANGAKLSSVPHGNFAGRYPAGIAQPITLAKNGVRHIRLLPSGEKEEVLAVGLACSECFSGPRLAKLLQPGFEYEKQAMEDMMAGNFAAPLSIHTSAGVPAALSGFIEALEPLLPWKATPEEKLDWCVSLQLEGASAVWAGIDMLLQVSILSSGNKRRKMVAVGAQSYHGPPSTSFGGKSPLWNKNYQVKYPVPEAGVPYDETELLDKYSAFLDKHGEEIGVMLVEPQWGSSQTGLVWPKDLLKKYISMARERGIKILCDEIMCGLGRHGQGTLFLSEAWDLDPDCVTFGKAIGGGAFPLSGAILKSGRNVLGGQGRSVMQSHTFAGSSARALMTGTEVLKEITEYIPSIIKLGEEMKVITDYLSSLADGMLSFQGHGLMWGCLFTHNDKHKEEGARSRAITTFRKHCENLGVIPYFVPVGGFMVTPCYDTDVGTIYDIGEKLEEAIKLTMKDIEWKTQEPVAADATSTMATTPLPKTILANSKPVAEAETPVDIALCNKTLHSTRSCTTCSTFVCPVRRQRFLRTSIA